MDLHLRLQQSTRHLNTKIEQSVLLKKMVLKQISIEEYRILIRTFYGFIMPCEAQIKTLACQSLLEGREKTHLLKHDMHALAAQDNISLCTDLPALSAYEDVLGYLYVMEGATLGGQIITRILQNHLLIQPEQGGLYFSGYGRHTQSMWHDFCLYLSNVDNIAQQDHIIHSASVTYNKLNQWMDNVAATV